MDIEEVINPTTVAVLLGIISTIVAGLIGRRTREAEAEQTEASAADKLAVGYTRLVDSWEKRLSTVQADLVQMRKESAEDRMEIKRLTLLETDLRSSLAVMKEKVHQLREELEMVKAERDAFREENEALWARIEELERMLGAYMEEENGGIDSD